MIKRISILLLVLASVQSYPYHPNFRGSFNQSNFLSSLIDMTKNLMSPLGNVDAHLYNESAKHNVEVTQGYEDTEVNFEEVGGYFEGDIMMPKKLRNGLKSIDSRWPGAVVPYTIHSDFDDQQRNLILEAMNDYHKYTCIKFVQYNGIQPDYVNVTANNTGCSSWLGRAGGPQYIHLQVPGCLYKKGTVLHELMHAIGFKHEHSRADRDTYVDIQWENIKDDMEYNFEKMKIWRMNDFGVDYDYGSVMHYGENAFSKNNLPTIVTKKEKNVNKIKIGQRDELSYSDIKKIRRMYNCFNQTWESWKS